MPALDFDETFVMGDGHDFHNLPPKTELPTSVLQALVSLHPEDWSAYCRKVLDVEPDSGAAFRMAIAHVRKVNYCEGVPPLVLVHIGDGWSVYVYAEDEL